MPDLDPQLIDRIVRDVLNTLRTDAPPVAATQRVARDAGSIPPSSSSLSVTLDDPVLTEASLESRIDGHTAIVVGKKTVLTPTARDFLRRHSITVSRLGGPNAAGSAPIATARWLALVVEEHVTARRAVEDVARDDWRHGTIGCWRAATNRAVALLEAGDTDGVAIVTTHTAAVGCLANRRTHVRAAIVDDVHGVKAARETIGTNVVVVDPTERTFVEVRNVLREFAAAGVPSPPHGWED